MREKINIESIDNTKPIELGKQSSYELISDPKRILFKLSRYKFIGHILQYKKNILELGCGDGMGIFIMNQYVKNITAIDNDEKRIKECRAIFSEYPNIKFYVDDISHLKDNKNLQHQLFDGIYMIDVIEHIPKEYEFYLMDFIKNKLTNDGIFIIGTPNKNAQMYESYFSQKYHINRKDKNDLYNILEPYFKNIIIFSMNDEVVHTGFSNMAHYFIAVGIGLK